jgi:hypothetical protein
LSSGESWRIPPETAGDGLLMSAPASGDFPAPFALAPQTRSIAANVEGGGVRSITVTFFRRRLLAPISEGWR